MKRSTVSAIGEPYTLDKSKFITPRKASKGRMLAAFDTEGDSSTFRGAAFWYDDPSGSGMPAMAWCPTREVALWKFDMLAKAGYTMLAHNAGYDLAVLFGQPFPPELSIRLIGTQFLSATYEKADIWDSFGLCPLPLAEIGEAIGCPKLFTDESPNDLHGAELASYCMRDAEIVYRLAHTYRIWAASKGISFSARSGTMAINLWAKTAEQPLPRSKAGDRENGAAALYAGRAEVWQEGDHEEAWIYDVNSMYPYVMASRMYPDPRTGHRYGPETPWDERRQGFWTVTVNVPAEALPVLPWHAPDEQTYWPTGRFTGTYTTPELIQAEAFGTTIEEWHGAYLYDRLIAPFGPFVFALYEEKQIAKDAGNGAHELVVKRILNSLWGRFALQTGTSTQIIRADAWTPRPCGKCPGCRHGKTCNQLHGLKRDGDYWIRPRYLGPTPDYVNDAWAAWTTSLARIRLVTLMQKAGFQNVIRVHTDSLAVNRAGHEQLRRLYSRELGGLHVEYHGAYRALHPSITDREDGARVAGVPRKYAREYLDHGEIEIQRPLGLVEGLGKNQVAHWQSIKVTLQGINPTRAEGGRRPWTISELQEAKSESEPIKPSRPLPV